MPFAKPWKSSFEAGDLLYGLMDERHKYLREHPSFARGKELMNSETNYRPVFIDHFQVLGFELECRQGSSMYESTGFDHTEHELFLTYLSTHPKYGSAIGGEREVDNHQSMRRKVKGGMAWVASEEKKPERHIHFLLDGIDFDAVIQKSFHAYTAVELRWVYRHRFDDNVQKHTQFWIKGQCCLPPWEQEFSHENPGVINDPTASWERYKPRSFRPWNATDRYTCRCLKPVGQQNGTFNSDKTVYTCNTCQTTGSMRVFSDLSTENLFRRCHLCNTPMFDRIRQRYRGTILPGNHVYLCHQCGGAIHLVTKDFNA